MAIPKDHSQTHGPLLEEAFQLMKKFLKDPKWTQSRIIKESGINSGWMQQIKEENDFKVFDRFRLKASHIAKIQDFVKKYAVSYSAEEETNDDDGNPFGWTKPLTGYDKFVKPKKEVFELIEKIYSTKPDSMEITITIKA